MNIRSVLKKSGGFTLIELVVVIALVVGVSLVLVNLFIGQNRIYKTQTSELNVTNGARTALDEVDALVRAADQVVASFSTYNTGPQTLVLQTPSINAQNQIIPATFDNVVFYLSNGDLMRLVGANPSSSRAGGTKKLAGGVTSLNFTYDNGNFALVKQVSTDLTVTESAGSQTRSVSASSKAKLRNN
ncbi:MAG TPA: prepilin-type N-terminal cleavage/methylation domain-containing protein [Patescibacteria group bacterium]|nr:prepilin-type N-terminal cleavage/methylation domain-containing protein [Patescibacteria group bacterium]